ncbi:MAG: hypothetical protein KDA60_07265 [Planctomycetales bacterium]|nr:hypothetical protein [Planctomycetales bacterium]
MNSTHPNESSTHARVIEHEAPARGESYAVRLSSAGVDESRRVDVVGAVGPASISRDTSSAPHRSLRSNVVVLAFANVAYGACQWLIMVALARTCSVDEVGRFARGLAVCGPIMMCTGLQLRTLLATDAAHDFRLVDYLRARLVMLAVSAAAVLGICYFVRYSRVDTMVILLVTAVKAVEGVGNLVYGYFQRAENIQRIARSMLMKGPAMIGGAVVGGMATHTAVGAVWGLLAGISLLTLAYDLPTCLQLVRRSTAQTRSAVEGMSNSRRRWGPVQRLIRRGLPLGGVVGLNSFNINVPRYFVDSLLGASPLGVFAGLSSLMRIGSYLELALVQSTQSRLAKLYRDGNRQGFVRLLGKSLALAAGISGLLIVGSIFLGKWVLELAYGTAYAEHAPVLVVLMVGGLIGQLAGVMKGASDAAQNYRQQIPIFACSLGVTVLCGAILVPRWGLIGAATSVVALKLSLLVGYVLLLRSAMRNALATARTPVAKAGA